MKRFVKLFSTPAVVAAFAAAPIHSTRPGRTMISDGFSNGDRHNQNILGKKD